MRKYAPKSNKFWCTVLCGMLLISAAAGAILRQVPANEAHIYQNGKLIEKIDLSAITAPYYFSAESETGINVIAAETGRIRVSEADCPDGTCIRQGWVSSGTTPIICLPHRLVIRLIGSKSPDIDALVG